MANADDTGSEAKATPRVNARIVVFVIGIAALAAFVFQNTEQVKVEFLFWDRTVRLAVLLLITVALSALVTVLALWFVGRRRGDKGGGA